MILLSYKQKKGKLKTNWDYSELAEAYLARPQYSSLAIDTIFAIADISRADFSCDIGAGVGHLTQHFLRRNLRVLAIEPNKNMRALGQVQTDGKCEWIEGTGENTNQQNDVFKLVTFGSSFNVCDPQLALKETARILKSKGWFACMWNHRNLNDSIQSDIEKLIKNFIPEYGYGSRREDQKQKINESKLFGEAVYLESDILHKQSIRECIIAWESHATLERQSGILFPEIIKEISNLLTSTISEDLNQILEIPYTTRVWMAQKKV